MRRGVHRIATGECGGGWARGLVAYWHYRASISLNALGNREASLSVFEQCLDQRGPGCHSIYRLDELSNPRLVATRPNRRLQPSARSEMLSAPRLNRRR